MERHCVSRSADERLLQAAYQKELYRAATHLLGEDGVVSCEVGSMFSVEGFIDFWINDDRNWAIELLRDGDRFKEHMKRMSDDGAYSRLVAKPL